MIYLEMNDGRKIPQLGFGVWSLPCNEEGKNVIKEAIKIGYRHFDTAHVYANEKIVGEAINESGLPRKEFFVTSKLWPTEFGYKKSKKALDEMLKRIRLDYIDLVLLHKETFDYMGAYKAIEEYIDKGLIKSAGVSNFETKKKIEKLWNNCKYKPVLNQLENHPYRQRENLNELTKGYGTYLESWSPLGHGVSGMLKDPKIIEIAAAHSKTTAQVVLRWHIQKGYVVIPMSSNIQHAKENFEIFDFELSDEEMKTLDGMDGTYKCDTTPKWAEGIFHFFQGFGLKGIDKAQK